MPCCKCDNLKVENRDLDLCSTCNRARRAVENPVAQKERKPIAPISAHRAAGLQVRAKTYKAISTSIKCCEACGAHRNLTPSHVLTQGKFKKHAANPRNIVVLCQDDHTLWENNKPVFREFYPEIWALKMQVIQELEPAYYEQFKLKNP